MDGYVPSDGRYPLLYIMCDRDGEGGRRRVGENVIWERACRADAGPTLVGRGDVVEAKLSDHV